eukprot:Nk52_evm52s153 gene=Nk52_evmTU52s153
MKRFSISDVNPGFKDPSSFAAVTDAYTEHLHLDLQVDFEKKILFGCATETFIIAKKGVKEVILDCRALDIKSVTDKDNGESLKFSIKKGDTDFGLALHIQVPENKRIAKQKFIVAIEYSTTPEGTAVQFLAPSQTAGKKEPFLFTQCQAIHCRSMIPCQDTPAVKVTYTANVTVPKGLRALMSAPADTSASKSPSKRRASTAKTETFSFNQKIPIPTYLIALAIGALESRTLGKRCTLYAEKESVEAAAWEFEETEEFLDIAIGICGPYEWGTYDILLLPPSFPYGGMENPNVTFVTPTLLAYDRSLVAVIAHEITHSWTGNLVTNATWGHFWINEGFTKYVERLIIGEKYGESTRQFHASLGWSVLKEAVKVKGEDSPLTCLVLDNEGVDPDDAFSTVPYEKGFALLYYLETLVGGKVEFMKFLKAYIKRFRGESIVTSQFKEFFLKFFEKKAQAGAFKKVNWEEWWYKPGMPVVKCDYDMSLADALNALFSKWTAASRSGNYKEFKAADVKEFNTLQMVGFLDRVIDAHFGVEVLKAMDAAYSLTDVANCEIKYKWQTACLRAGHKAIFEPVKTFLVSQGRMKYTRALYRDLHACGADGKKAAEDLFIKNESIYHPICSSLVRADLKL